MKLNKKLILVTGGSGFIGSHLCEELLSQGAKVICVDNFSQSTPQNIEFLKDNSNFFLFKVDCNNYDELKNIFENNQIDFVFHYAATVGVKRTQESPLRVLEDIDGIKNIYKLSFDYKVKKVIFASSSEVYGEPVEIPEREEGVLNAQIPYAQVKLIGESYAKAYWEKYKLPTVSLRFFNVYGPRQESSDYGFVVGIFMKQAIEGKPLTVVKDGTMTRNFVFVKDNVRAAIKTLSTDKVNGKVLNIGTGQSITILQLAEKIIKISGKKLDIALINPRNNHEIIHRQPDISKQQSLLQYQPSFTLDQGLGITYKWYLDSLIN